MSDNTQNLNQITPSSSSEGSNDSHESIGVETLRIQDGRIHYPMPLTGTVGAPYFTGQNVTDFLERFDNMCEEYGVKKLDKIRKLPWYCEKSIGEYIRMLSEYEAKD